MTREECEKQILEKCKEISEIVKQYDPHIRLFVNSNYAR